MKVYAVLGQMSYGYSQELYDEEIVGIRYTREEADALAVMESERRNAACKKSDSFYAKVLEGELPDRS